MIEVFAQQYCSAHRSIDSRSFYISVILFRHQIFEFDKRRRLTTK